MTGCQLTSGYYVGQVGLDILMCLIAVSDGFDVAVHFDVRFFGRHQEAFPAGTAAVPAVAVQTNAAVHRAGRRGAH